MTRLNFSSLFKHNYVDVFTSILFLGAKLLKLKKTCTMDNWV